jgi:trehalose utilization protein
VNKNVTQERMDEDENQRVTDVFLDPARHAYNDLSQDDDDRTGTHTSQNKTAYGYTETQRKVAATNVLIFRHVCNFAAKERGMQDRKQLLITNFYKQLNLICNFTLG